MYATRHFQVFVLAVSVFWLAHASWRDLKPILGRDLFSPLHNPLDLDPPKDANPPANTPTDQDASSSSAASPTPSSGASDTSSPSAPSHTKADDASAPTKKSTTSSQTSTSDSSSKGPSSTPVSAPTPHSSNIDAKASAPTTATPKVSTSFSVMITTNSNGEQETLTTAVKTTATPGLSDKGDNETSGLSSKSRNVIIGVVVGVGGAIIIGALGLVAWRVWGRKRNVEETDGLMAYNTGYSAMDKSEPGSSHGPSASARSPFQSTLDNYHEPAPANASQNF